MGRKGIGKLSMFALANLVKVTSQSSGCEAVGFEVNVPDLKKALEQHSSLKLKEIPGGIFQKGHGTKIILEDTLTGLNTTASYLKTKLARRFSVLGDSYGFKVLLNDSEITMSDRGFYQHVQFLWAFDQNTLDKLQKLTPNLASITTTENAETQKILCASLLDSAIPYEGNNFLVTGYVASVFLPKNLGKNDDSANIFSIFANGRVFSENILDEANSAKYYQNYLVGEVHANFLDDDDIDRATASREAIKRDDPRYKVLLNFIRTTLENIGDQWDEWRTELGLDPTDQENAAISEWLGSLDKRDEKIAKRLMTSIKNATLHSDDLKNYAAKKILYRGAIIGFEKLKLKNQLDKLSSISDVLSVEFATIFSTLSSVEESAYFEITKQRLEVIKKFKEVIDNPATLEKVAQKYLFDHLWLLDPSWDRVGGQAQMELTLTKYLKAAQPDTDGARLDISYRASTGRHVIVELKRPNITNLDFVTLYGQAVKYKDAITSYYRQKEPNKPIPALDIYLLIAKTPNGFDESKRASLAAIDGKIITYSQLINDANTAYQAYLDVTKNTNNLEEILAKL